MKRLLASILILPMLVLPVQAETIKWVDFNVPYESHEVRAGSGHCDL